MITLSMKTKLLIFFVLITLAGIFSIAGSWIVQYRLGGEVNFFRAAFQIVLFVVTLYLLWQKSTPGYILAILYVAGNLVISAFAVFGYLTLWNATVEVPMNSLIVNFIVILTTFSSLVVFLFGYMDYRKRKFFDH